MKTEDNYIQWHTTPHHNGLRYLVMYLISALVRAVLCLNVGLIRVVLIFFCYVSARCLVLCLNVLTLVRLSCVVFDCSDVSAALCCI